MHNKFSIFVRLTNKHSYQQHKKTDLMEVQEDKKRRSVDFSIKAAWLAISKMYNMLGTEYDMTHSLGFVLLNIDRENGTPATKIAPLMGMEARSLTRMLKSLEENELIEKKSDKEDKRKVMIHLTEKGKLKRELSRQTVKSFHSQLEEKIGESEFAVFFQVIEKIHRVIENHYEEILEDVQIKLAAKGITEEKAKF